MSEKPFTLQRRPGEIFAELEAVSKKHKKFATPGFSLDQAYRVYYSAISRNPELLQCTNQSLIKCLLDAASLGLFIGDTLGQCYAVPFKNNRLKPPLNYEAQFIMGYQGMIELVRRSGEVESMTAELIYENDEYSVQMGTTPKIHHIPFGMSPEHRKDRERMKRGRGEPILGYCITRFRDGGHHMTVMSIEEIDAFEKRSRAGGKGPWKTDRNAMRLKTLVRREYKFCPKSPAMMKATELEDRLEMDNAGPLAVEAEVVEEARQTKSERMAADLAEDHASPQDSEASPTDSQPEDESEGPASEREDEPEAASAQPDDGELPLGPELSDRPVTITSKSSSADLESAQEVVEIALKNLSRAKANMVTHKFCKKHGFKKWQDCENEDLLADLYDQIDGVLTADTGSPA